MIFLLLSADEVYSFHEMVGEHLFANYSDFGVPMFGWVVPYTLALILLTAIFLRWFFELESRLRFSLFMAAGIFLFGAIGLELVASNHYESLPVDRETYRTLTGDLLSTVEEACECIGLSIFLHALIRHLGGISIRALDPMPNDPAPAAA